MSLHTFHWWQKLKTVNEEQALYRQLWFIHYRRALWAPSSGYSASLSGLLITIVLSPIFLLIPFLVTPIFGTFWTVLIAGMIRYEYQTERFDLMGVLPGGAYAAYETIATLHLRRSRLYSHLGDALSMTGLVGGILLFLLTSGMIIGLISAATHDIDTFLAMLNMILIVALVTVGIYLDQIQATVVSLLVGMVTPLQTRYVFEARLWSGAAYLLLQVIVMFIAFGFGFGLIPQLLQVARWQLVLKLGVSVMSAFALRETVVRVLEQYMKDELGMPMRP